MLFKKQHLVTLLLVLFVSIASANAEISAAIEDRLKSCDPKVSVSAAEEIVKGRDHLQDPVLLLRAASIFYQYGRKEDAVFWYYAGHLRTRQQMAVDGGRGRVGFVEVVGTIGQHISVYAQSDAAHLEAVLAQVLEWDAKTANVYRERAESETLKNEIDKLYAEYRAFKVRLSTEKSFIEAQHKAAALQMNRIYKEQLSLRCHRN
jgi:hypothetical protein